MTRPRLFWLIGTAVILGIFLLPLFITLRIAYLPKGSHEQALAENSVDACHRLPKGAMFSYSNPREACYRAVAIQTRNYTICEEYSVSNCYTEIALAHSDPTGCEKLKESIVKLKAAIGSEFSDDDFFYVDDCYIKLAVRTQNPALCDRVTLKKMDCRKYF